jgi:hypothetical protein
MVDVTGSFTRSVDDRKDCVLRLQRWFRAYPYPLGESGAALDVVAEEGSPVGDLLESGLVDQETVVFAAGLQTEISGPGRVVPVEGSVSGITDELRLDDELYVETFDYLSAPYLAVTGPAVVRLPTEADHEAFIEDADQAVRHGRFAAHLLVGNAQLADLPLLAPDLPWPGLSRLYLTAAGTLHAGPWMPSAGSIEHVSCLDPASRRGAFAAAAGAPPRTAAQAARPWLSRYVIAVEVLHRLELAGPDVAVSGFNFRFVDELTPTPIEGPQRPVLVWTGEDVLAVTPPQFRMFRISRDAGTLLEIMEVGGGDDEAAALAARMLGITAHVAHDAYARLLSRLGCPPPPPPSPAGATATGVPDDALAAGGVR